MTQAFDRAQQGDFGAIDILVDALHSADEDTRLRAAYFSDRIGPAAALPRLCELAMDDGSHAVRNQSIAALVGVGLVASVPTLIEILGDADPELREDAEAALYRLVGDDVPGLLRRAHDIDEPDPEQRSRLRAWWAERSADFDPEKVYHAGVPASPAVYVDLLEQGTGPDDAITDALLDWTGISFGTGGSVARHWRKWCESNCADYTPGVRYFFGHPVPVGATPR